MALIVVISVVSGFHEDLQKKILGTQAHAVVLSYSGGISDYRSLMELLSKKMRLKRTLPL